MLLIATTMEVNMNDYIKVSRRQKYYAIKDIAYRRLEDYLAYCDTHESFMSNSIGKMCEMRIREGITKANDGNLSDAASDELDEMFSHSIESYELS
jgi:hypothetical protein